MGEVKPLKHIVHALKAALVVVAAAIPAIVADPSVAHYAATHPWVDVYLPIVVGIVHALANAKSQPAGAAAASTKPA